MQSTRIVGSVQLCTISATDHIGHKPYRPRPHRPHEKTISAERNNHIGHKKMYCCGYYVICGCSGCPFTSYIIIYWLHCRDCRRRATCHPQYTGQVFTARHRPDNSADVFAVVIVRLANLSFRDGRFPACFTLAEVIVLGTVNQFRSAPDIDTVQVDGASLSTSTTLKSLGVVLDQRLTFHDHANVVKSCNYHTRAIRHIHHLLTHSAA